MQHTLTEIDDALRRFVLAHGFGRAGYWIGEDAADALDLVPDHYRRWTAAKVLRADHAVTVDFGYTGRLNYATPSKVITLNDLTPYLTTKE